MSLLPSSDDYACFTDGDAMFTTPNYGDVIDQVVLENLDVGCFTCFANRVGSKWQLHSHVDFNNNDMEYHRKIGQELQDKYGTSCVDVTYKLPGQVMSGVMILIKKSTWSKIGGFKDGMLQVDNDIHWKIQNSDNEKLYLMKGIYLYHWYRYPNYNNTDHLK